MAGERSVALLEEIAQRLQIRGDNPFRVRAFERAARAVEDLGDTLQQHLRDETLTSVRGIGASIAADLVQMQARGSCDLLDELRAEQPPRILDLLQVQGLGPKRVSKLLEALGVGDLQALKEAASRGQIAGLAGFGAKTQDQILVELERLESQQGRHPVASVWPTAQVMLHRLRVLPEVERAEVAGSLRRGRESVGDVDLVVASRQPEPVMRAFVTQEEVEGVLAEGQTKSSVLLRGGLQVDLRVVEPEVFGATLLHFTGSKEHNVRLRALALERGLRVSEWGVFRRDEAQGEGGVRVASQREEDVYAALGMAWVPPELREDRGEVEAALAGGGPQLVALEDIQADLHMHTTWSDGSASIGDMAAAARALGRSFLCITDHSGSLAVARGLTKERLEAQIAEIDRDQGGYALPVLRGLEVDILEEGDLDMDDATLERLDWVVGSVHTKFGLSAEAMTTRLVRAVRSGLISAIGHPTTRLVMRREGIAFDFDAVLDACEEMGVALEINASPWRLDLSDGLIRRVLQREGVWLSVNTDAHAPDELDQMHFGVRMARRGGAPPERILNTLPLDLWREKARRPQRA